MKDNSEKNITKKRYGVYIAVWCVFCITVIVKMSLSTAMSSILSEHILDKPQISSIIAAYWIVYAIGQPFGGALADKIKGEILLSIALACSAVLCVAFSIFDSYVIKLLCWAGVGLAQFAVWPSVTVFTSKYVSKTKIDKAITYLAFSYPVGNVLGYGVSAAILLKLSWKYIFAADGAICVLMLVAMIIVMFRCMMPLNSVEDYDANILDSCYRD